MPRQHANATKPRVMLAHDWLVGRRGGELVLDAIIRTLEPEAHIAGIITMFDDGRPITAAIDRLRHYAAHTSTRSLKHRRLMLPLYPSAVRSLSRTLHTLHSEQRIDLLISTHSAAIKALKPPAGVPHLCYCHTPARYIWSQTRAYGKAALPLALARPLYKNWDRAAASVDTFLANSTHIAEEIQRCYDRHADVVFPPVRTGVFTPDESTLRREHWLAAGALVPYKRFDLAVAAANQANHPLKIVGDGPERRRLQQLAGPTVTFERAETDAQMCEHFRSARLLLQPQLEDFGITALEAQACGTPVVAFAPGGARDTVRDGATGATFDMQSVDAILEAIDRCPKHHAPVCREHAERFSENAFRDAFAPHARALLRR